MWNTCFLFALYSKAVWKPTFYKVNKMIVNIKCCVNYFVDLISKGRKIHSRQSFLTSIFPAASLIFSTFASDRPLMLLRALRVVIWIPFTVQMPTDFSFLMSAMFCGHRWGVTEMLHSQLTFDLMRKLSLFPSGCLLTMPCFCRRSISWKKDSWKTKSTWDSCWAANLNVEQGSFCVISKKYYLNVVNVDNFGSHLNSQCSRFCNILYYVISYKLIYW